MGKSGRQGGGWGGGGGGVGGKNCVEGVGGWWGLGVMCMIWVSVVVFKAQARMEWQVPVCR